jgi:hypothetical protein
MDRMHYRDSTPNMRQRRSRLQDYVRIFSVLLSLFADGSLKIDRNNAFGYQQLVIWQSNGLGTILRNYKPICQYNFIKSHLALFLYFCFDLSLPNTPFSFTSLYSTKLNKKDTLIVNVCEQFFFI